MPDPSILLIDDDPFALDLMAHYVGEVFDGSAVFTLPAGDQASILCRANAVDCVVVDYNMPGQNGLDLAKSLRREVEPLDRVARKGRHPNIVELRYAHLQADPICLEYEYVGGGDLAEYARNQRQPPSGSAHTARRLWPHNAFPSASDSSV